MKKILGIISLSAGIISAVSAIVLCCMYLDNISKYIQKARTKFINKRRDEEFMEEYDYE